MAVIDAIHTSGPRFKDLAVSASGEYNLLALNRFASAVTTTKFCPEFRFTVFNPTLKVL